MLLIRSLGHLKSYIQKANLYPILNMENLKTGKKIAKMFSKVLLETFYSKFYTGKKKEEEFHEQISL